MSFGTDCDCSGRAPKSAPARKPYAQPGNDLGVCALAAGCTGSCTSACRSDRHEKAVLSYRCNPLLVDNVGLSVKPDRLRDPRRIQEFARLKNASKNILSNRFQTPGPVLFTTRVFPLLCLALSVPSSQLPTPRDRTTATLASRHVDDAACSRTSTVRFLPD
jgi:hypothetical protein